MQVATCQTRKAQMIKNQTTYNYTVLSYIT